MKPPNIAIFIDVIAIYLFLFLFLPLYREPIYVIEEIDTRTAFPILRRIGPSEYVQLDLSSATVQEMPFEPVEGIFLTCTGWCEEQTKTRNVKGDLRLFVHGSNFKKIAHDLLTRCVGIGSDPCHNDREYVLAGQSVEIIKYDLKEN